MTERKEITKTLSLSLEKHINPYNDPRVYMAREVTFDYATSHAVRVDYIQFKPLNNTVSGIEKGDFFCFEVKSSVDDFHSKNGHNFLGDYNYYVMPEEVYEQIKAEIPLGYDRYFYHADHHYPDWRKSVPYLSSYYESIDNSNVIGTFDYSSGYGTKIVCKSKIG